jgi:peptidoglycan hydrolase-like protein with peptidoglycan-binding domain
MILFTSRITGEESFHPCECSEDRIIKISEPFMEGEDIRSLQKRLRELGYYNGPLDGIYGYLTYEAVKNFQQDYVLNEDGIVDAKTWDMLANLNESILASRKGKSPDGDLSIVINLYSRTLSLFSDGKAFKTYPVTIGKKDSPSPVGEWRIINKYERISGGPLGSRWMGLDVPWGVYGIHGTNKPWEIGTAASKGCIRLHNQYVEELFDWVEIGTPVKIIGPRPQVVISRIMREGSIGYDVMELQERLRERGFYNGFLDGRYGTLLTTAIKELETQYQLKADGIVDKNILNILELEYNL